MTKLEFSKTVRIFRSHSLKNAMISITFSYVLSESCQSVSNTVVIKKIGGALNSLYISKVC